MNIINGKRCDKIMVVEDEWIVADQLCNNLKDLGYMVCGTASTGAEAVKNAKEYNPDLILMDIVLKNKMDGIEAAEQINSEFNIPVIYLTSYTNQEYIERAKKTRPFGYLVKPFKQGELYANIEMALHKHRLEKNIQEYQERLVRCYRGTIESVSGAIELRGPYTPGHHKRVAQFAETIARKMGLSDFSVEGTCLAAYVYDVGLVCMPLSVIQDSAHLTGVKLNLYRSYPRMSYEILAKIDFPWPVADIVLQHCECYDGSGFPNGIRKNDILIEARILAVAHALEDLTSHKSFRNAFSMKQALDEIKFYRESKYDPNVVDVCVNLYRDEWYKLDF